MSKPHGRTWLSIILIATVGLGSFAGIARGSHDSNTFHACGRSGTGALRKVDDASQCKPAEEPLEWNVAGPPGETGAPGISGYEIVTGSIIFGGGDQDDERTSTLDYGAKSVMGGGFSLNSTLDEVPVVVLASYPDTTHTWSVRQGRTSRERLSYRPTPSVPTSAPSLFVDADRRSGPTGPLLWFFITPKAEASPRTAGTPQRCPPRWKETSNAKYDGITRTPRP